MMASTSENSNTDAVADAHSQLQSLSRVSHRLAMVDDSQKLQKVLDKLLPRLLQRIGENNQALINSKENELKSALSKIHIKLIEILSHIMKRVRDDKDCRLTNARGILDLLLTTANDNSYERTFKDCDSYCLNLSLAFLTLAVPRCTLSELDGLLPGFLILHTCYERRIRSQTNVESSPPPVPAAFESIRKQSHQISHLLLRTLERIVAEEEAPLENSSKKVAITSTQGMNLNKRMKTDVDSNGDAANESKASANIRPTKGIEEARLLLSEEEPEESRQRISIADATYDLLLDAMLYQTQVGNVPPAGMSSAGWIRMKCGHSIIERDWAAEMAPLNRLATFKNRILEWIAPNRRFCLFLGNPGGDNAKDIYRNLQSQKSLKSSPLMAGRSRTVSLLVTASGDPMKGVSGPAKQYLKQYYDSQRETGGFGNAGVLTKELLTLCVGGINAENIISTSSSITSDDDLNYQRRRTLGILRGGLSFRRRQVSDSHFSELILTVKKALDDLGDDDDFDVIGKLSFLASDKMLSKLGSMLGLSLLRGKPYIAAAELLNGFVVRLEKHRRRNPENDSESKSDFTLNARVVTLVASILAPTAASRASSSSSAQISEASVAVRDSIYCTMSILCRSRFAQEHFLCLLAVGDTKATSISTGLFQLLFRCIGNEIDKLRPRATAALDALLFACQRLVKSKDVVRSEHGDQHFFHEGVNPWGGNATSSSAVTTGENIRLTKTVISPAEMANQIGKSLIPILWNASHSSQPRQSRVAAARWCSDLLVDLDVKNATHILSFLAGDADVTAASIAKEGLGFGRSKRIVIPDFEELVNVFILEDEKMEAATSLPTFWDFSPNGKTVAVKCLLRSYLNDFNGGDRGLRVLMSALTKCLVSENKAKNEDLIDACSEAYSVCIETSPVARGMIKSSSLNFGLNHLRDMIITSTSAKAKLFLADAFGNLLMDTSLVGSQWTEVVTETLAFASKFLAGEPLKPSNDVQGAALLGGICVRLIRLHPALLRDDTCDLASKLLFRLGNALTNVDEMIGNISCDFLYLSCSGSLTMELNDSLKPGMASVLENLTSAMNKFGHGDRMNAPRVLKLIEPTSLSIAVSTGLPERSECVGALFKLLGSDAFRKDEEIGLAIGEALALFAEGCITVQTNSLSKIDTRDWPMDMDEVFGRSLIPAARVVYTLLRTAKSTSNNHKRRACAPALLAVVARATRLESHAKLRVCLQQTLHEIQDCFLFLLVDAKSNQMSRESCCLGLAACNKLVVASESQELQGRLLRSFGSPTNYGGSAMQETMEQAAQRRREDGANGTENFESTATIDVGGAGGVSEAALGAYREMASAAVASGRPDILYSMLILSVSHSIWFSTEMRRDTYGPSSLQVDNVDNGEVKTALRPFLAKLLPRILRASYDPNKRTREQMETLWIGLTGGGEEGRRAISDNLRPTMDALVEETSSKFWRARVGACLALSQICVGRSWADLGGGPPILDENYDLVTSKTPSNSTFGGIRLLRLWRAVIRALDDVRITVRESGESLGRSVRSLTIFLCNPFIEGPNEVIQCNEERERGAISASATALRWLLRNGLKQQCPEAAGICISALIGIIDVAKPAILEALLSDVIHALLMAMSNLEPAAFSYLAVREERGSTEYENLARLRIQASQNSPLATAVRKCIDLVPKSKNLKYQEAVVPALESAIRKSSGMATRTAAAECVITLCTTCPHMFQVSTSSSSLLRCFFEAVYKERGGKAAQGKMNSAFGALSALCPGTVIRPLASLAADRYKEAHGSNDDAAMRNASAMILRSIAVKASNHFSDPGNSDVWCKKVLPISFLGVRDSDKNSASLWREVWEEGGAAVDFVSSASDTGNTLEENLLLFLTKECVKALEDRSWSRRVTAAVALSGLAEKEILAPLPHHVQQSRLEQARMRNRVHASRIALSSLVKLLSRNRIWTGKHEVVRATVQLLKVWIPILLTEEAKTRVEELGFTPITFGDSKSENDLFLKDGFFADEDIEDIAIEEEIDHDAGILLEIGFPTDEIPALVILGTCRLLLMQSFPRKSATRSVADEEVLPYRSNVLQSLETLLKSLPDSDYCSYFRSRIFCFLVPKLWRVFCSGLTDQPSLKESPLIVARSIDCFASCFWPQMNFQHIEQTSTVGSFELTQTFLFHVDLTKQSAWTVREAAAKGASKFAQCADFDTLQRRSQISILVDIAGIALKDSRFWKVRFGGLEILLALILRIGDGSNIVAGRGLAEGNQEKQLLLEIILPYKENIQDLAKKSLNDSEAKITAHSTRILSVASTWP